MKRLLLISLLLANTLLGYSYNELLLKAQSDIFPKIMLLDRTLEQKLVDGEIVYTVAYKKSDRITALAVRDLLIQNHGETLGGYPFRVQLKRFDEISAQMKTTVLYALNTDEEAGRISKVAQEAGFLTFAYDIDTLSQGMLLSLIVEKTTVLYLNRQSLQHYKVDFVDSLYQIVRFSQN